MDTKKAQYAPNMPMNPGAAVAPGFGMPPAIRPGVPNQFNSNMMLNPGAKSQPKQDPRIPEVLSALRNTTQQAALTFVPILQIISRDLQVSDPELAQYLMQLMQAIQFNNDSTKINRNMQTVPGAIAAIDQYLNLKTQMMNKPSNTQQQPMVQTAQILKKKKKTRGNPFKVLMGKFGKLLDHGLNKNQITKYLAKEKYWNTETVEKAVDIVKDYNKKKHSKAVAEVKRLVVAEAQEWDNLKVTYDILSTPDLLMRKEFLEACVDGVDLGVVPKSPKKELGVINNILEERSQLT